ncbi:MAG: type II secretion system F family protein [Francisellaceae bacterium]
MSVLALFKPATNKLGHKISLYNPLKVKGIKSQFNSNKRVEFYNTFQMLLESKFSVEDAIDQMRKSYVKYGRKAYDKNSTLVDVLNDVHYRFTELGYTIIEALSPYIPEDEMIILASDPHDIRNGLKNVVEISQKLKRLKKTIVSSLTKPLVYIFGIAGMMYYSAKSLMPQITSAIPKDMLPDLTARFDAFNNWFVDHGLLIIGMIIALIISFIITIPRMTNKFRIKVLDGLPPYSIYKKIIAVKFLISLSLMLNGNKNSLTYSLRAIRSNANDYLKNFINTILTMLNNGVAPGASLAGADFFSRDVCSLIDMYANAGKLEAAIYDLANNYLDKQIDKIQKSFSLINTLFLVLTTVYLSMFMSAIYAIGINAF